MKPGRGMNRRIYADGGLHVLMDDQSIVFQVRTRKAETCKDALAIGVKIGVEVSHVEALEIAALIVEQHARQAKRATVKERKLSAAGFNGQVRLAEQANDAT